MKCKNCNVEVSSYLKECPLCHEKLNINITKDNPYNYEIENFSKRVNTIYFSKIILKILIFSSLIILLINYLVNKRISWSLYVLSSSIYLSSFYTFIIYTNKKIAFIINNICLELLLFTISYLTHNISWFLYLVGPIILILTLFIYINVYLTKYNNVLRNFSILLTYLSISLFILNILIKLYKINTIQITWSLYTSIILLPICIICFILSFNKKIENEIEKRFFI